MNTNSVDNKHSQEVLTTLKDIQLVLERAYPPPEVTVGHKVYTSVQKILKYLGIPALILAAIIPIYDMARGVRTSLANDNLIKIYVNYSIDLLQSGKIARAETVLNSLNVKDKIDPRVHYAKAKIAAIQALIKSENIEETEDLIKILITLNEKSSFITGQYGDENDYYRLKLMLSDISISKADYVTALSILDSIESNITKSPTDINASFHLKKGTVFVWQNKYEEAKKELNSFKHTLRQSGKNEEILAEMEFQLAKNEQFKRNYDEAILLYLSSKENFENSGLKRGQIKTLNNLGMIYFTLLYNKRDNKKAIEYYASSAEIAKEIGDFTGIARAQMNIGGVKLKEGNLYGALQIYILSLENFKSSKNKYGIALAHSSLGNIYGRLGKSEKNYYHSKLALEGLIDIKDTNNIGMQAGEIADAAGSLGNKKDNVIYNYLSVIYRRATKDKNWKNNFRRLKEQEVKLGVKLFSEYVNEAKDIAQKINIKLQRLNINLILPDNV